MAKVFPKFNVPQVPMDVSAVLNSDNGTAYQALQRIARPYTLVFNEDMTGVQLGLKSASGYYTRRDITVQELHGANMTGGGLLGLLANKVQEMKDEQEAGPSPSWPLFAQLDEVAEFKFPVAPDPFRKKEKPVPVKPTRVRPECPEHKNFLVPDKEWPKDVLRCPVMGCTKAVRRKSAEKKDSAPSKETLEKAAEVSKEIASEEKTAKSSTAIGHGTHTIAYPVNDALPEFRIENIGGDVRMYLVQETPQGTIAVIDVTSCGPDYRVNKEPNGLEDAEVKLTVRPR